MKWFVKILRWVLLKFDPQLQAVYELGFEDGMRRGKLISAPITLPPSGTLRTPCDLVYVDNVGVSHDLTDTVVRSDR